MVRGLVPCLACALLACSERGSITSRSFTVTPLSGDSCTLIADLVSDRDSSNVDITVAACSGSRCSGRSSTRTEGPFVPGRAKTVAIELDGCPDHPDRIDVAVSRWGSRNNALPTATVEHLDKSPDETRCRIDSVLHTSAEFGDSTVFLVARDHASRPAGRELRRASKN
jgi:hypothetical protein